MFQVMFKMDQNGNGMMISQEDLHKAMEMEADYTFDKFCYMCILSGCDYLPSPRGIGLKRARDLIKKHTDIREESLIDCKYL